MNKCWCAILFYNLAGIFGIVGYLLPEDTAVAARVVIYVLCQVSI
jgi:hypothetical protein